MKECISITTQQGVASHYPIHEQDNKVVQTKLGGWGGGEQLAAPLLTARQAPVIVLNVNILPDTQVEEPDVFNLIWSTWTPAE